MRERAPGPSIRLRLAVSYAGFLLVAWGALLLVMAFVLRFLPDENLMLANSGGGFVPNRSDLVRAAAPVAAWGTLVLAVVGVAGGWWLAGWMLRPLDAIGAAAQAATRGELSHRIDLDGPDDELRRLADAFDEMLARLEAQFDEQRRFSGNASHELQTPHSVMRTIIEVARADPAGRDTDLVLARLQEVNDRSIATTAALLRLAAADHGGLALARCDLAGVVREGVRVLDTADVAVSLDLDHAPLDGDRVLLTQLVENLLHNAVRHNLPAGGTASIRVRGGATASLVVENTGEVVPADRVGTLLEPFVRGGGRVADAHGRPSGSGLGLSLVRSVARTHGGDVSVRAREGGGLVVAVELPGLSPGA